MNTEHQKTITICGSIAFYDEMLAAKAELEREGWDVKLPPTEVKNQEGVYIPVKEYYELRKTTTDRTSWVWDRKSEAIKIHNEKIASSDAVLIFNQDKNGISGYVGGNTLMEMAVAFYLGKKIYLYKQIPEMAYTEEILGMKPVVIDEDLSKIM